MLSGNTMRNKHRRLAQQGERTTGIVTSVIEDTWLKIFSDEGIYHHSIRFVTTDQRWVSKSYTSLFGYHGSRYREGQTINIVYNPADREEFIIDSSPGSLGPLMYIIISLGIFGYSIWLIFKAFQ